MDDDIEDEEGEPLYNDEVTNNSGDEGAEETRPKRSEEILNFRVENGMICRQFPVKETRKLVRSEVIDLWEWLYSFFCKGDFEFLLCIVKTSRLGGLVVFDMVNHLIDLFILRVKIALIVLYGFQILPLFMIWCLF